MANQRKSYRNVLATAAGAAVVASAMAPGAVAADDHTAATQFPDVSEDTRHYAAIDALYQADINVGYHDGNYYPEESLTRIQAALMLDRATDFQYDGEVSYDFPDVPEKYSETVDKMYEAGIFQGTDEGLFQPNEDLTRIQMAQVLVEAYDLPHGDHVPESDFNDRGETALNSYMDAVAYAGVAQGYEDGNFGHDDEILRKDFAAMLHAAMNWEADPESEVTVSDVGQAQEIIPGANAVEIDLSGYEVATDANVQIKVGDTFIDLPYDEERGTFAELQITGFDLEELSNAIVYVDGEPLAGVEEPSTELTLGTVTDVEGNVQQVVPGAYAVELDILANENVDVDSEVVLQIGDEEVVLPYNAERGTFVELQVTGYTQAELEAATVVVR